MSFVIIIIGICLLGDLLVWAVGARRLRRKGASMGTRLAFHAFMLLEMATLSAMVFGRSQGIDTDDFLPQFVLIIVYIWHLLVLPFVLLFTLVGWVMRGVRKIVSLWFEPRERPPLSPLLSAGAPMSRREFLGTAMVLSAPLLTLGLGGTGASQLSRVRVRDLVVHLPRLPAALEGLTIAHVTDTHVGRFTHGSVLDAITRTTNELNCDLVMITGDVINDSPVWIPEAVRMLEGMNAPVILCEGNHDLFLDARGFRQAMKEAKGVTALFNESTIMEIRGVPVQFLGLRWGGPPNWQGGRHDEGGIAASMKELLAQRMPDAFPILLVHHPHAWDYAREVPLTFAGHTHGGQFMINERMGMGPAMFRYWSGLYERDRPLSQKEALVVSNGAGNWFPLRIEAPAEIIRVTLRRSA